MKGICECENQTKLSGRLTEFRSRLFENQGTHFMLHFSFFILHYTFSHSQLPIRNAVHADGVSYL
jgi:hypothetical protein